MTIGVGLVGSCKKLPPNCERLRHHGDILQFPVCAKNTLHTDNLKIAHLAASDTYGLGSIAAGITSSIAAVLSFTVRIASTTAS